jgi:signal transduction histidine kinase
MEFLVEDLLDYAQIKAGKFRMNLKRFDIRKTVKEVIEIQQQKADAKNINLKCEFNLLENIIYHDEKRISQVLLNL